MKKLLLVPFLFMTAMAFSQNKIDSASKMSVCPICKSNKDVVPIIYGKPATALIKKAERGECWLGGCVVDKDSPWYYCKKDKKSF